MNLVDEDSKEEKVASMKVTECYAQLNLESAQIMSFHKILTCRQGSYKTLNLKLSTQK